MIEVVDNLLPKKFADTLEDSVNSFNLQWYWNDGVVGSHEILFPTDNTINVPQFVHNAYLSEFNSSSDFYLKIFPFSYFAEEKFNIDIEQVWRCKVNLLYKNLEAKDKHHPIHRDKRDSNSNSFSIIYYPEDSDGDTLFFDDTLKIVSQVKPKKNRAVLFNSNNLHCSSSPLKHNKRTAINFVFAGEKNDLPSN